MVGHSISNIVLCCMYTHTSSSSLTLASVFFLRAGSSIAKAGYPVMQSREASVSLELDSFGRRLLRMTQLRYWASGSTWMVETREPCSPNRFSPFIASSAAFAIPMELEGRGRRRRRKREGRGKEEEGGRGGGGGEREEREEKEEEEEEEKEKEEEEEGRRKMRKSRRKRRRTSKRK